MQEKSSSKKEFLQTITETACLAFLIFVLFASYWWFVARKSYTISDFTLTEKTESDILKSDNENLKHISEVNNEIPYITETRTIREYRGGLGVYDCFGNLLDSYDVNLSVLTDDDKKSLKDGIVFENASKVYEFLESFDS